MASSVAVGEAVQTPFGKGVVREVRNGGRLLIDLQGRSLVVDARTVTRLATPTRRARAETPVVMPPVSPTAASLTASRRSGEAPTAPEVDLHGLTVADALARAEQAVNEALLADLAQLRLIHGKSGGRIRAALHRRLAQMPSVRTFGLDARNAGVTIVSF